MAVLIPDVPGKCTGSERQVFQRLERELDDDWIVLHSLGLANHDAKLWGEADFVVLSTKGLFVLEVKGGDVSCQDGIWHYGKPGSRDYFTKREGPFKQAKDALFALKKILDREPDLQQLLTGYGVVMPHAVFAMEGPEIEQGVLLDKRNFPKHLGFYIGNLSRFWDDTYRRRHGQGRMAPTLTQLRKVRQLLRPDIDSTLSLASYLNGLEEDLLLLTNRQIQAARGMDHNPRTVISGRAGTGKTVLSVDRARRQAALGKDVLFICFNRLLAQHVEFSLRNKPEASRIRVRHLHGLMRETITKAGMAERLAATDAPDIELYGRIFPELFVEAALMAEPVTAEVLVVDEAQDLLTTANLDALDLLIKDGFRHGNWNLFLDPLQNIYGKDSDEAMRVLVEAGFAKYELYENCRNTRQVAIQTSIISGIDMSTKGAVDGMPCECIYYADHQDLVGQLDAEVERLIRGGVEPRDIIVLSTRRRENSSMSAVKRLAGVQIRNLDEGPDDAAIHYSTMHAFKGLERKVVLAIDLEGIGDEMWSLVHYAGLSRAIGLLRPLVADHERKNYRAQTERFAARMARYGDND